MQSYHLELIKNSKTLCDRLYFHRKTNSGRQEEQKYQNMLVMTSKPV